MTTNNPHIGEFVVEKEIFNIPEDARTGPRGWKRKAIVVLEGMNVGQSFRLTVPHKPEALKSALKRHKYPFTIVAKKLDAAWWRVWKVELAKEANKEEAAATEAAV